MDKYSRVRIMPLIIKNKVVYVTIPLVGIKAERRN